MLKIVASKTFEKWLKGLRDQQAKARILDRIDRLPDGNFGDTKSIGDGINELRLHFGPGYRVYFMRSGDTIVILLNGGDKGSQKADIARAKSIAREWSERN